MKFTALPAHDLTDVTLDLEQLQARDILDQSSTTILQLAVAGTKRKIAFGINSVVIPGGSNSASVSVTHGLGATPVVIVASTQNVTFAAATTTYAPTTFALFAFQTAGGTGGGTVSCTWVAIG